MNDEMVISNWSNYAFLNVISFYMLTNFLKDVQRIGEKIWKVQKEHYGSIAEHIYCEEMLAIIIYLIYAPDIDICSVVNLISIHELGEIKVGDITALLKTELERKMNYKKQLQ